MDAAGKPEARAIATRCNIPPAHTMAYVRTVDPVGVTPPLKVEIEVEFAD